MAKDYFKHSLPEHILQALDLDTLQPVEQTFIDDHWHKNITDVLFQVTAQGKPGYIYVLLEHMSTQDKWLPYRMLKYVMGVIKHHMDTHDKAEYLPIIIPCLLHTGEYPPFRHSLDILDLFGDQKELAEQVMFKPLHLIDLPRESDEDLMGFELFYLSAMFAKHIRDPERILQTLAQMHAFMVYLCNNGYESCASMTPKH